MDYYTRFNNALITRNVSECINITKEMIDGGESVLTVYSELIEKSFKEIGKPIVDEVYDITSEHITSAILRTVIENLYQNIEEKNDKGIVVVCGLQNEAHNIGARIVADYFRIAGFETIFLDVNIPIADIVECVNKFEAKYIAISITNFFNLATLSKLVTKLRNESSVNKILVGGLAVQNNIEFIQELNIDYIISDVKQVLEVE